MRIYGDGRSGNCYKIQLLLAHLGRDYDWVAVDILAGETRREDFLRKNPNGKIPLLERDDGSCLVESNAILHYLAEGSALVPADPWQRALVLQWQCFEQYSHEPYIAVARYIAKYLGLPEEMRGRYESKQAGGHKALAVMDQHLSAQDYFVAGQFSIADISLYAYTHVADEGGFDLGAYPAVRAWLDRVAAQPGHRPMDKKTD